jgi:hypothetical protein
MGKYSSRLKVMTRAKSSPLSRRRRISSRYSPTGVLPVGNPSTVGRPAELFWRMRFSIMSATCRAAWALVGKTSVGTRVLGT